MFNNQLNEYCKKIITELGKIPIDRQKQLQELSDYIRANAANASTKLIFICTHNSRRSHFGQIWMYAAAKYYGIKNIQTYSGGTEATAANIRTMKALERAGFLLEKDDTTSKENPTYYLGLGRDIVKQICFSKVYDNSANPQQNFAAIMVCSSASEACPFVPGADKRFSITYTDPKYADDTPDEEEAYDLACRTIATEMFFVANEVLN